MAPKWAWLGSYVQIVILHPLNYFCNPLWYSIQILRRDWGKSATKFMYTMTLKWAWWPNLILHFLNYRIFATIDHRRIADEYCGGAAVTKFPTKYFCIELCVESFIVRVIPWLTVSTVSSSPSTVLPSPVPPSPPPHYHPFPFLPSSPLPSYPLPLEVGPLKSS